MANFSMLDEITTAVLEPPPRIVPEPVPLCATDTDTDRAPAWIHGGHIPGLDGLRAVAVLMVLAAHMYQTVGFPDWPHFKLLCRQGANGVDIFFVISGFLITTLLAREIDREGQIDLKKFYLRRSLRIIPAYFALVLVVAVLHQVGYVTMRPRDWIGALTYTSNFYYRPSWELGHSWSLAIEEHFYLLWPFVLYAGGIRWGWRVGVFWLVACALIRIGIALGVPAHLFPVGSFYHETSNCSAMAEVWTLTRLDTITMGSLLALLCRSDKGRAWLDRWTTPKRMWLFLGIFCLSLVLCRSGKYTLCASYTVNGFCIAMLIWGMIRSEGVMRAILNNRWLRAIGLGSYSLYLWQQLFINPHHAGWVHQFPQNMFFAVGAACLSFWLIERPMNRLKDRVAG